MAAALAEGGALLEKGGGAAGLTEDTSNAGRASAVAGVVSKLAGLGTTIIGLVSSIMTLDHISDDFDDSRLALGLIRPNDPGTTMKTKRLGFVVKGVIPAYYSFSNISRLLKDDKIPSGWSTSVLVAQGFGEQLRIVRERLAFNKRKIAELEDKKNFIAIERSRIVEKINKNKRNSHRMIERIQKSMPV